MPDRITAAADKVQEVAHQLVDEVRKIQRVWLPLIVAALVLVTLTGLFGWLTYQNDQKEDDRELLRRQCNAWEDRVEHDAVLVDFLAEQVANGEGESFVAGLRDAYAESNADYAAERGLTKERCA